MYQQTQMIEHYHPFLQTGVGTITLSRSEYDCLELAYYFLAWQLPNDQKPAVLFGDLKSHHLQQLRHWLDAVNAFFNRSMKQYWEFTFDSLEDVEWLALALTIGLSEDIVMAFAADKTSFDLDMVKLYVSDEQEYSLADLAYHDNYRGYFDHYADCSSHKDRLLLKLRTILND